MKSKTGFYPKLAWSENVNSLTTLSEGDLYVTGIESFPLTVSNEGHASLRFITADSSVDSMNSKVELYLIPM